MGTNLLAFFYWDSNPELFRIPVLDWPVLWYGVFFALGFGLGFPIFVSILTRFWGKARKKEAVQIADRLVLYVVLGTVIGARLGHLIFYEKPEKYLGDPLLIFQVWGGGLASHGGAIGIIVALLFFRYRMKGKNKDLTWIRLLDFISIPTALASSLIRIGNFINQEILGKETDLPWGVIFLHPADYSYPVPRHPVVLYESIFYFLLFCTLWRLSFVKRILSSEGKLIGIFLMLVFGFRIFIEIFKEEQSRILTNSSVSMGQILSIPIFALGLWFFLRKKKRGEHSF